MAVQEDQGRTVSVKAVQSHANRHDMVSSCFYGRGVPQRPKPDVTSFVFPCVQMVFWIQWRMALSPQETKMDASITSSGNKLLASLPCAIPEGCGREQEFRISCCFWRTTSQTAASDTIMRNLRSRLRGTMRPAIDAHRYSFFFFRNELVSERHKRNLSKRVRWEQENHERRMISQKNLFLVTET